MSRSKGGRAGDDRYLPNYHSFFNIINNTYLIIYLISI